MRFSSPIFALSAALLTVVSPTFASPSPDTSLPDTPTLPNPYPHTHALSKRTCIFGFCIGGGSQSYDLLNDVNNCGYVGNSCNNFISGLLNCGSGGAICSNGVCGPASCKYLFDFNWLTRQCQNVAADTQNCGRCGQVCTVDGASSTACSSGTCLATQCQSGYTLSGGKCNKVIDTTSDINNCGAVGRKCAASYPGGTGVVCQNSLCKAASCNNGALWNPLTMQCQSCLSDNNNCGSIGNVCSYGPGGYGQCQSGKCVLQGCNAPQYMVGGKCTTLDLTSDVNNCGSVNNVCSFPNGNAQCVGGSCTLSTCNPGFAKQTTGGFLWWPGTTTCVGVDVSSDEQNCGRVGNICPAYANGGQTQCVNGQCQPNGCNSGYDWDILMLFCRPVHSDVNNCGKCGQTCAGKIPNAQSTCSNGQCVISQCNPGYSNINGVCTQVNTASDINNCGAVGNKCPLSYPSGSGVSCVSGVCRATNCLGLTDWDPLAKQCRDVSTDLNNCGKCGVPCFFANGVPQCNSGVCSLLRCNPGFQNVGGKCVAMDVSSDLNNCGSVGNKCSFVNGQGVCSNGQCTYTQCVDTYKLVSNTCSKVDVTSDPQNCGRVGNICPSVANGGTPFCSNSVCSTQCIPGFDWDSVGRVCKDVRSDTNNCGKCGNTCLSQLPGSMQATCSNGQCTATVCQTGYTLAAGKCTPVNTQTDPNHCGGWGQCCTFSAGATGKCLNGVCTVTGCPSGYTIQLNACVPMGASQKPLAKRSKVEKPKSLCPDHEEACPIAGSSTYDQAVNQHFSAFAELATGGIMAGRGGYECIDTKQALDSCGGCASTGQGQDCSKIRGAVGVGCDNGTCVVFSCQSGWKPNLAATKCVRAHTHGHNHSSTEEKAGDAAHAARRHLAARSHGHGSHGHS